LALYSGPPGRWRLPTNFIRGGTMRFRYVVGAVVCIGGLISAFAQEAPLGGASKITPKEQKALDGLKGKVKGKIVWSSSRSSSKHDIWIMNADGTDKKQLTNSPDNVDWFSRFSPDGSKVLFARSSGGWVKEMDAEIFDLWNIWVIGVDGSNEHKVAEKACWGTWRPNGEEIVFARGPKVFIKKLASGDETEIFDAEAFFSKKKVYCQQPELSPNGKFLAITIRGTKRETGIYNLEKKQWYSTGAGCQINWLPDNKSVVRMNEGTGNGDTEILRIPVDADGKPTIAIRGLRVPKEMLFMDLPGRRSHEYFPQFDQSGKWLVWCATQYGHEHDIVDYEVFIWDTSTDKAKDFVRLTFHSGNDRWPDIHTGDIAAAPAPAPAPAEGGGEEE
jgi:dipeptidyl aminopeptidase/acylaminoacyl peptidase